MIFELLILTNTAWMSRLLFPSSHMPSGLSGLVGCLKVKSESVFKNFFSSPVLVSSQEVFKHSAAEQ